MIAVVRADFVADPRADRLGETDGRRVHLGFQRLQQAENRAAVVLAEAEIPKAMAEAFRSGNLGVFDYYKLKNVQADTAMRDAIGKPSDGKA